MALIPPEIPHNIVITPAGTSITVTWDGIATSYQVRYAKSADNIVLGTFTPGTRSQVIPGLLNNTGYQIIITNTRDGISYSTEVSYALPTTCADIVNVVVDTLENGDLRVVWDAVPGIPLYRVAWFEVDKFGGLNGGDSTDSENTEYVITNLKPCNRYVVRVMYQCSPEVTIASEKVLIETKNNCSNDGVVEWTGTSGW